MKEETDSNRVTTQRRTILKEIEKRFLSSYNTLKVLLELRVAIPLIIGIAIRLVLAPYTEQRWDMYNWRLYSALLCGYKKNPFWMPSEGFYSWGYPPLWLLICLLAYMLYNFFWPVQYPNNFSSLWGGWNFSSTGLLPQYVNVFEAYRSFIPNKLPFLDLFLKAPIIAADILIGVLLYLIIKNISDEEKARHSLYIWIFNPFVIFISSIWGMFDLIPIVFVLTSLYYILHDKYGVSSILLGIGICLKLFPIVLVPVYAIIIYLKTGKIKEAMKYIIISGCFTFIIIFPAFYLASFLSGEKAMTLSIHLLKNLVLKRASPDWRGKNIFTGLTPLVLLNPILNSVNLEFNIPITPMLLGGTMITILLIIYKRGKPTTTTDIISYTVAVHYMIYLTYGTIHTPHLTWVLPLLLLLSTHKSEATYTFQYWALSVIGIIGIVIKYDLSYFVSPYFLWNEMNLRLPTGISFNSIEFVICFTYIYIHGLKSAFKISKVVPDE